MNNLLLEAKNLKTYFQIKRMSPFPRKVVVKAVDGVDLQIFRGETLGLVGESGCGKTTLGRTILRLVEPDEGEIYYYDKGNVRTNLRQLSRKRFQKFRKKMQIIFQNPYGALNPRMNVRAALSEPFQIHHVPPRVSYLLDRVGLPGDALTRYPHEFSGGQRQRIVIARALALHPQFLVCDEPVSALDVSIRVQILNLLEDFKKELGLSYLFISHDLSVVEYISERIAVMYLGKIVEIGKRVDIIFRPLHPYTRILLSAVPVPDPTARTGRVALSGDVTSAISPLSGCRFHPRCPRKKEECRRREPELIEIGPGHQVACHLCPN